MCPPQRQKRKQASQVACRVLGFVHGYRQDISCYFLGNTEVQAVLVLLPGKLGGSPVRRLNSYGLLLVAGVELVLTWRADLHECPVVRRFVEDGVQLPVPSGLLVVRPASPVTVPFVEHEQRGRD